MAIQQVTQTGNIPSLLREGLATAVGNYSNYSTVSRKCMKVMKSHRAQEMIPEMQYTPTANLQGQGASANYATIGQLYLTTATNNKYGCGVILTRECIEDNLYDNYFPLLKKRFMISHQNNEEISFANLVNNGFIDNASTNLADGKSWFNTAHPLGAGYGTSSNTISGSASLNSTTLLSALSSIKYQFKDATGIPMLGKGLRLVVDPTNWAVAVSLVGSKYNPDTASNAVNPIFSEISEIEVSPFLNPGLWMVTTDHEGLYRFDRTPLDISVIEDPNTYEVRINSYRRFVDCVADWRSAFGARSV